MTMERKGTSESSQGFLATRNPRREFEALGVSAERQDERRKDVLEYQAPPRSARLVPDTGPSGLVDGLVE
jgi:hypothetical protein